MTVPTKQNGGLLEKQRQIELANLVIKFGVDNLLDRLEDRIWPALVNGKVQGKGETEYYKFHHLSAEKLGDSAVPAIYGRLIAKKTIEAEQDFDETESTLLPSDGRVSAVPSSFFVLTLSNHKLAFIRETRRGPSLRDFEYCIRRMLEKDWKARHSAARDAWIKKEGLKSVPRKRKAELDSYLDEIEPKPDVRATPLPSTDKLEDHLRQYALITRLKLTALKTNDEFPDENDEFIKSITGVQDRLKGDPKVEVSNPSGLVKPETEKLISAAANGNYEAKLKGRDQHGHELSGDLKSLAVKIDMLIGSQEPGETLANKLLNRMKSAFAGGLVKAADFSEDNLNRAREMVDRIRSKVER